jgi:dTDP-glucose 4,6-dehydratase
MGEKVLVTGGAGFIGSSLVRRLLSQDFRVTVFDDLSTGLRGNLPRSDNVRFVEGDVRDFSLVSSAVRGHRFVVHLAARAFVPYCYDFPVDIAEVNALGSLNVFKACLEHGVERLVHLSSSEVYGSARFVPMSEEHPLQPFNTYGAAKAVADMWAQTFFWEHKLPVVVLRLFNTFGPFENLPYFIPEMIRQCLKERVIRVGNLDSRRDFTFSEDAAEAIFLALVTSGIEGSVINVGSGKALRVGRILEMIMEMTDAREKEVVVDESRLRPRDVELLVADNARARRVLGWKPTVSFEEGLRRTIAWYKGNGMRWGYEAREV